ncbi:hypothetical protein F4827_003525 [Paraburkholderia bannensis]|uniref:Uncharacterized protein n=1 Tax=Paraburkholderia bannensis TaxID=765414 RepID=A0A7W9U0G6_9BURK|nr:hypothetical protein [Paraburkholderia sp. WP4_3_2]MBB6103670.1 hypothetical protein [Paraburkholderia bannensis]
MNRGLPDECALVATSINQEGFKAMHEVLFKTWGKT